jgi:hypothetical protein
MLATTRLFYDVQFVRGVIWRDWTFVKIVLHVIILNKILKPPCPGIKVATKQNFPLVTKL